MKKLIFVISLIVLSGFLFGFSIPDAKATTTTELQTLIQQLQAQIATLQQQLAQIQGEQPVIWCHTFNVNLKIGDSGTEVKALRTALAKEGFSGLEAMGGAYEFDERVASAVVGFQEKYASEILAPWGLTHGTGYVGPTTRAKLNKLYGCGVVRPYIQVVSPNGGEQWVIGKTYDIKWKSTGFVNNAPFIIFLKNDELGKTCRLVQGYVQAGDGKYSWTIGKDYCATYPDIYYPGNKLKITITQSEGMIQPRASDESDNYFSIVSAGTNLPPVIDGLTAPTQLKVNETGTWTIKAHDPENGPLTYSVRWGDEVSALTTEQKSFSTGAGQTTTFTHSYSKVGKYTISFTVTDDKSQTAKTSTSVEIVSTTACTDSDGGKDYYVKGNCLGRPNIYTDEIKTLTDYCTVPRPDFDYNLIEYSCGYIKNVLICVPYAYKCPYGCKDGACQKEYPAACTYLSDGVQASYMAQCGDIKYNPVFDLNKDKIINISDFGLISVNINNESWCNQMKASTENPCVAEQPVTELKNIENQLASLAEVVSSLMEQVKDLLGK